MDLFDRAGKGTVRFGSEIVIMNLFDEHPVRPQDGTPSMRGLHSVRNLKWAGPFRSAPEDSIPAPIPSNCSAAQKLDADLARTPPDWDRSDGSVHDNLLPWLRLVKFAVEGPRAQANERQEIRRKEQDAHRLELIRTDVRRTTCATNTTSIPSAFPVWKTRLWEAAGAT